MKFDVGYFLLYNHIPKLGFSGSIGPILKYLQNKVKNYATPILMTIFSEYIC